MLKIRPHFNSKRSPNPDKTAHDDYVIRLLLHHLDASGKIRIWDTTQKEHMLKYEYTPISGKVKDIAWTEDSKRIAVVGDGREK